MGVPTPGASDKLSFGAELGMLGGTLMIQKKICLEILLSDYERFRLGVWRRINRFACLVAHSHGIWLPALRLNNGLVPGVVDWDYTINLIFASLLQQLLLLLDKIGHSYNFK